MALVLAGHLYLSLSRRTSPPRTAEAQPTAAVERFDDPILASCSARARAERPQFSQHRYRRLVDRLLKGEM